MTPDPSILAMYEAILDKCPDGIFVRDLEGRHVYVNDRARRNMGTPAPLGRTAEELLPAAVAELSQASDQVILHEGVTVEGQYDMEFESGRRTYSVVKFPWRGAGGEMQGVIGIARDVTARARAERMLEAAEELAGMGSWELDLQDDALTWSRGMFPIFGLPPGTPISHDGFRGMVLPQDLDQMRRMVEQAKAIPGTHRNRLRIRRPDGEVRVLDVKLRAEFLPDGRPRRLTGTSVDITELARVQQALEERGAALEEANRLLQEQDRSKERLVDAVSHDLRTPLSSIVGYAEFLLDELDGPLSAGQRESIKVIDRAAKRLTRLADDLLDFARLRQGPLPSDRRVVDLNALVAEELALLQPMAHERQVVLALHMADGPTPLEADATRLGRALSNLITNAIKFTRVGGEVAVHVAAVDAGLRVEVRDSGVGIPLDQLDRVFEPFVQAGPPKGGAGLGLGLAIARAIVEAHGGRIGATSHEGQGSTFWLELPAMVPLKAV